MRKCLLIGTAGLTFGLAAARGQNFNIYLDNYDSFATPIVTYGANVPTDGVSGPLGQIGAGLSSDWSAGLYYVDGTVTINDPAGSGIPAAPLTLGTGTGATAQIGLVGTYPVPGYFISSQPFSTQMTTVTLEIVAYPTSAGSYAAAQYRGHSDPFTMPAGAPTHVPIFVGDYMQSFSVTRVPEPMSLALGGLGLTLLVWARRKWNN